MVDEQGNVKEYYDYYPFGKTLRSSITDEAVATYKFTGKELDDENYMDWYDFGARPYDPEIGRFLSVDRFADKYPSLSPYQYCGNNPINLIDVNGNSIWIHYTDDKGISDKLLYTTGMSYQGNNKNVAALISTLNKMSSAEIGNKVLSQLIGSTGNYNVAFGGLSNADAGGQFQGNTNNLGGNFAFDTRILASVGKIAHEFFHGYQHDMGSGGASILSEVEANLFGAAIQETVTGNPIHMFGNNTEAGNIYTLMMFTTLYASQYIDVHANFHSAMSTFKQGSFANSSGLYSNFPLRAPNQRILINKLYPLMRR